MESLSGESKLLYDIIMSKTDEIYEARFAAYSARARVSAAAATASSTTRSAVSLHVLSSAAATDELAASTSSPTSTQAVSTTAPTTAASTASTNTCIFRSGTTSAGSVRHDATKDDLTPEAHDIYDCLASNSATRNATTTTCPTMVHTTCSTTGLDHVGGAIQVLDAHLLMADVLPTNPVHVESQPSMEPLFLITDFVRAATPMALDPGAAIQATPDVFSRLTSSVVNNVVVNVFATPIRSTCSMLVHDLDCGNTRVTMVANLTQDVLLALRVPAQDTTCNRLFRFHVLEQRPRPWPSFECSRIWSLLWSVHIPEKISEFMYKNTGIKSGDDTRYGAINGCSGLNAIHGDHKAKPAAGSMIIATHMEHDLDPECKILLRCCCRSVPSDGLLVRVSLTLLEFVAQLVLSQLCCPPDGSYFLLCIIGQRAQCSFSEILVEVASWQNVGVSCFLSPSDQEEQLTGYQVMRKCFVDLRPWPYSVIQFIEHCSFWLYMQKLGTNERLCTIAQWPPPSCTCARRPLIHVEGFFHHAQQGCGKSSLAVGFLQSPWPPPLHYVKDNQLKWIANWLELREDTYLFDKVKVVQLESILGMCITLLTGTTAFGCHSCMLIDVWLAPVHLQFQKLAIAKFPTMMYLFGDAATICRCFSNGNPILLSAAAKHSNVVRYWKESQVTQWEIAWPTTTQAHSVLDSKHLYLSLACSTVICYLEIEIKSLAIRYLFWMCLHWDPSGFTRHRFRVQPKFRSITWSFMGSCWVSSELGKAGTIAIRELIFWRYPMPPVKQMVLKVSYLFSDGNPIEVGLLIVVLVHNWLLSCFGIHNIQDGFAVTQWKIAWSQKLQLFAGGNKFVHLPCANRLHVSLFADWSQSYPTATVGCCHLVSTKISTTTFHLHAYVTLWTFCSMKFGRGKLSWDPSIEALLYEFFAPAAAQGGIMLEAPTYCYDHYTAVFDQVLFSPNYYINIVQVRLDHTYDNSYHYHLDSGNIREFHVPWDPGGSTWHRLGASRKLWRGDCQRPLLYQAQARLWAAVGWAWARSETMRRGPLQIEGEEGQTNWFGTDRNWTAASAEAWLGGCCLCACVSFLLSFSSFHHGFSQIQACNLN